VIVLWVIAEDRKLDPLFFISLSDRHVDWWRFFIPAR
jgi:hypothetical protein